MEKAECGRETSGHANGEVGDLRRTQDTTGVADGYRGMRSPGGAGSYLREVWPLVLGRLGQEGTCDARAVSYGT